MFLHLSVSHSAHREGACPIACWDTPARQVHPLAGTSPWQVPPLVGTPPGRYTLPGRYTPLAGTLPGRFTPGRYTPWQVHPLAGTPPAGTPPTPRGTPPWHVHPLRSACWDMVNKWVVRIPLECNLVVKLN